MSTQPIQIGFISLGCAKNLVDSEVMLGALLREGMALTQDVRAADVVIVNTCGFIEASKQESINAVLKANTLRETGRCKALIMAGCLSQRYPKDLQKSLPEVDAFVGLNEVPRISEIVRDVLNRNGHEHPELYWSGPAKFVPDYSAPRYRLTPRHSAYVKIAEGCDHPCTFCSIPRIRGRHRSRPLPDVLAEIRGLVAEGVREINLISQDTTFYGRDLNGGDGLLSELLREAQKLKGEFWVRLLYTHPAHWTDELIDTIAACDKVCRYVDVPLQHINDRVLQRMRRETDGAYIRELIRRLRAGIPGLTLRTTFIVGFPGETDAEFAELLTFVEETKFERLGVFQYSQEDHTAAATMTPQVPGRIKKQRYAQLMSLQQRISRATGQSVVGQTLRVLAETQTARGGTGRGEADAPEVDGCVKWRGRAQVGAFVRVRVTGAGPYELRGEVLAKQEVADG